MLNCLQISNIRYTAPTGPYCHTHYPGAHPHPRCTIMLQNHVAEKESFARRSREGILTMHVAATRYVSNPMV